MVNKANKRRKNLPTVDKMAVLILNDYNQLGNRDILFAKQSSNHGLLRLY